MATDEENADGEKPQSEGEAAEGGAAPKQGFIKKLLGNKKMLMIFGGGTLALLLALGAGAYFFLFSAAPPPPPKTPQIAALPALPPQVAFYEMPDIVVNIQSADSTPAFLKLSVSLELDTAAEKPGLQALMPRIVDQFQAYLRELRIDDLKGSAGVLRLKEELLRRINDAAAPYRVKDVLLKQMIVQ
ncbi:MAG TPA: flagellar basal body-associated FliL family protein [Rhizomicrobium sp.]|nr:flagellar basal body-associated FliL family protein [Rhizomicrobium sp.]